MKNISKLLFTVLPVLSVVMFPALAGAQTTEVPAAIITDVTDVYTILNNVLNIVYTIFFIIAAFFIILAAFQYLTAQGDPEKTKTAKNMIIYAIVAIVVALLAVSVRGVVENFLDAT